MEVLTEKLCKVFDKSVLSIGKPYAIYLGGQLKYYGLLFEIGDLNIKFAIVAKNGDIDYYNISAELILNNTYKIGEMKVGE